MNRCQFCGAPSTIHLTDILTTQLLTAEESMELMRKAAALGPAQSPAG